MTDVPREPEAFTEHVARKLKKHLGRITIKITGPLELTIDDRRVDLDDLHRATMHGEDEPDDLIRRFADAFLAAIRVEQTPLPFDAVRHLILPRIQPLSFFRGRRSDLFAAQGWVNDTVILYVIDFNGTATPITTEQLIHWGLSVEELDEMARENLSGHQPDLELKVLHGEDGAAALFNTGDGYDAARLLLDELHPKLSPEFGRDFLAAIPTRDVFIAFPLSSPEFIGRLRSRIRTDYRKLPYPITDDLFLVTLDGVAGWGEAA